MSNELNEWAPACIALLKGPIIKKGTNDKLWNLVIRDRMFIDSYFAKIGLTLLVEEGDGYAFLRQKEEGEDEDYQEITKLIRKVRLTPEESFLCVILREALDYFESSDNLSDICALTESEIIDRLKDYSYEYTDELRFKNKLRTTLNKLQELGYVEDLTDKNSNEENHTFEVKRIIRAIITPSFLEEFRNKIVERNKDKEEEDNE